MEFKNDLESMKHLLNVIEEHMKHDLYAVGFIGEALVNVNTFNDYLEMKPQMFQAVNDMKESLEYLLKLSQEEVNKIPTLMPITNQHHHQQQQQQYQIHLHFTTKTSLNIVNALNYVYYTQTTRFIKAQTHFHYITSSKTAKQVQLTQHSLTSNQRYVILILIKKQHSQNQIQHLTGLTSHIVQCITNYNHRIYRHC